MYFPRAMALMLFLAAIQLIQAKSLFYKQTKTGNSQAVNMAISPPSWRCEIDQLGEFGNVVGDSCEDNVIEDDFYVLHGSACKVFHSNPVLHMTSWEIVTCQQGRWSGTDNALDIPHPRHKRWGWVVAAAVAGYVACKWWCKGKEYKPKTPPTFTNCPPSDLQAEYFTPAGEESTTVDWKKPIAHDNDDDGSIQSLQQVIGTASGGSFAGSTNADGQQHTVLYVATDANGLTANCYFSFKVKVRTCGALLWPTNGYRDCPKGNIFGSTCTYRCIEGYQLSGPSTVTCEGENNPAWSNVPTCEKISCETPPSVTNGNVTCNRGHVYGSYCVMSCENGYELEGQVTTRCESDGEWFWGVPTTCTDDVPPVMACNTPQVLYADRGSTSTSVTWEEPTATDNIDLNPTVTKTGGPDQGATTVEAGNSAYVTYKATDADANESPPCTVEIRVEAISCGHPLDTLEDADLRFSCSMSSYTFGDTCTLDCSLNLPLEGTDLISCERNNTVAGMPSGYWDWGNGSMPFCRDIACPALEPPTDGALVSSTINSRPTATILCNNQFDVPDLGFNFNGIILCQDSGVWLPNFTRAPSCTETVSRAGYRLASEFYYDGVCTEDIVLAQFQSIVSNLNTLFEALCPTAADCAVENPEVTCGPVSGKKKRSLYASGSRSGSYATKSHDEGAQYHMIKKRQSSGDKLIFSFDIKTDFDSSNMTDNEAFAYVDSIQLELLKPAVQQRADDGEYDYPGWTFDSFQTADYGDGYCGPGSVPVRLTKCSLCPPGYYEASGVCTVCPVGEYSDTSGAVNCTACPDGYSTRQTTSESADYCTKLCSPGSYSPDTFVPCAPCKAGYYQPLIGQSHCTACPAGMSTKTVGSKSDVDCQYFDVFLGDTVRQAIEADIPLLNDLTLTFFIKTVSAETPDIVMRVDDELEVFISENITVVTPSTDDILGPSSRDFWVQVGVTWDTTAGLLTASYKGSLVVSHTPLQPASSPMVQGGILYITAVGDGGVMISGLRLQDTVIGLADSGISSSCQTVDEADVVQMDIFKNRNAEGVSLIVPPVCDAIDECLSNPCGIHGTCTNNIGDFTCTCFGGWSGITCNVPPDFCIANDCTNGATCISDTIDYTCQCQLGYTGVYCEFPPVDGGWSEWTRWTECTVTCDSGTRERTRVCDSPEPGEYGQNCAGDAMETENCNIQPCPVCLEPERGFASILDCNTDPDTGTEVCTAICRDGYDRPAGLDSDTYRCGVDTGYKWVPKRKIPGCVKPDRSERYTVVASVTLNPTVRQEDVQEVTSTIQSNVGQTDCFNSTSCEAQVSIASTDSRRRRNTGSTVTVTFSIAINDTSDLQLEQYATDGTISPGLQEIIDAINNLESTASAINDSASSFFDVTTNGVTYSVDTTTLTFDGSASCSDGLVVTNGLCAACPAGSYQVSDYCSLCDKGTYQEQTGQTSCIQCPSGYTTETIGSDYSTDCSVTENTTTSSTVSTVASTQPSSTETSQTTVTTQATTSGGISTVTSTQSSSTETSQTTVTTQATTSGGISTVTSTQSSSTETSQTTVSTQAPTSGGISTVTTTQPSSTDTSQTTVSTQATTSGGISTGATSTSTPQIDKEDSNDQKYIYIGVAIAVLAVCVTVLTVTFLCLKKHFADRAKISDSSADMRGHNNLVYDHPPPIISPKQEPHNTKFSRESTTLTVRDLDFQMVPERGDGNSLYE